MQGLWRWLFHLLIFGSWVIAAGAAGLCWSTFYLLELPTEAAGPVYLFVPLAVLLIYNFDRLFAAEADVFSIRHEWIRRNRRILVATVLTTLPLLLMLSFLLQWEALAVLLGLGVLSLAYSLPYRNKYLHRLKEVGLLKIFLITLVWSVATVWVPLLQAGVPVLTWDVTALLLQRALFIFAICLPFDIRDLQPDELQRVETIPGRLGARPALYITYSVLAAFTLWVMLDFHRDFMEKGLPLLLSALYLLAVVLSWRPSRDEYFYSVSLDGGVVVWPVLLWTAQRLLS